MFTLLSLSAGTGEFLNGFHGNTEHRREVLTNIKQLFSKGYFYKRIQSIDIFGSLTKIK